MNVVEHTLYTPIASMTSMYKMQHKADRTERNPRCEYTFFKRTADIGYKYIIEFPKGCEDAKDVAAGVMRGPLPKARLLIVILN